MGISLDEARAAIKKNQPVSLDEARAAITAKSAYNNAPGIPADSPEAQQYHPVNRLGLQPEQDVSNEANLQALRQMLGGSATIPPEKQGLAGAAEAEKWIAEPTRAGEGLSKLAGGYTEFQEPLATIENALKGMVRWPAAMAQPILDPLSRGDVPGVALGAGRTAEGLARFLPDVGRQAINVTGAGIPTPLPIGEPYTEKVLKGYRSTYGYIKPVWSNEPKELHRPTSAEAISEIQSDPTGLLLALLGIAGAVKGGKVKPKAEIIQEAKLAPEAIIPEQVKPSPVSSETLTKSPKPIDLNKINQLMAESDRATGLINEEIQRRTGGDKTSVVVDKSRQNVTPEKTATNLGIKYDGMQERAGGKPPIQQFTDPQTKTTFYVDDLSQVGKKLAEKRAEFEKPVTSPVESKQPTKLVIGGEGKKIREFMEEKKAAKPKEPWEMTREEYIADRFKGQPKNIINNYTSGQLRFGHILELDKAIRAGKTIPESIIKNYPELWTAAKYEPTAPSPLKESQSAPAPLKETGATVNKPRAETVTTKRAAPAPVVEGATVKEPPAPPTEGMVGGQKSGMKTELVGKGETITINDIRNYLSRELGVPIRTGHIKSSKFAGIYKIRPEVARAKDWGDIPTISHEVAHHLYYKNKLVNIAKGSKELKKLDYEPQKGRINEGFAEYVRMWMTGEDVASVAPQFTQKFNTYLSENPQIATKLKTAQNMITRFREQGAVERIKSQIGFDGNIGKSKLGERFGRIKRRLTTLWLEEEAPIEWAEKQIRGVKRLDPEKINPETSPTMLYRDAMKTAGAKAKAMVNDGVFDFSGKQVAPSLKESLSGISKSQYDDFAAYIYSKRAIDLHGRGKNPGVSLQDAKYTFDKLDSPVFRKSAENINNWQNAVLDYLVEAGGLSSETKVAIRELNPFYIPLKRAFAESSMSGISKKVGDVSSPIKRIKGSGRPIVDPLESIITQTAQIISTADRIRIQKALVDLSEKRGAGRFIEKVPPPQQAQKITLESLSKQLEDAGVDITDANLGEVITVFSNAPKYLGKDNIVSFWKNGKREFYEIDPELFRSFKGLDDVSLPWAVRFFFQYPTRGVRLGATGLRAGFSLITNPMRDAFGMFLQSEATGGKAAGLPYYIGRVIAHRTGIRTDQSMRLWERSGADMSQFLGLDKKSIKMAVSDVFTNDAKTKSLNVVKHPIEALKEILSVTEAAPRLAEFESIYKKGEQLYGKGSAGARIMAANASSDVTVNFRRAGVYGSVLNQIIPFWNASVQGMTKFGRSIKEHPYRSGVRAVTALTVPTVILWNENKDKQWYKELPDWQKYGFWHFAIGGTDNKPNTIIRVPRPFEWGLVFASGPEAVLNYVNDKNPEALKSAMKQMIGSATPDILPAAIRPAIEVTANYDYFRDADIVPYYTGQKLPEDQFTKYTSMTMKEIGALIGYSPAKLEHLASGYSGGMLPEIIKGTESTIIGRESIEQPADIPIVGRLFTRQYSDKQRAERVKYELRELEKIVGELRKKGRDKEADARIKWFRAKYSDLIK